MATTVVGRLPRRIPIVIIMQAGILAASQEGVVVHSKIKTGGAAPPNCVRVLLLPGKVAGRRGKAAGRPGKAAGRRGKAAGMAIIEARCRHTLLRSVGPEKQTRKAR